MELTELSFFKDKHVGRTGFVCGTGTSLSEVPKDLHEKGVLICVNGSAMHFERCDYLFITDDAVPHMTYWERIRERAGCVIFANPQLEGHVKEARDAEKVAHLMERNYANHHDYNFSNETVLCLGQDAPVPATHLAVVMGLQPIILCGIDLCYNESRRYYDESMYEHNNDSPYKDSFAKQWPEGRMNGSGYNGDIWLSMAIPIWGKVFDQNTGARENILNASSFSKIPHFKKINLNDYLSGI